jgi:hypothetical protein
MLPACCVDPDAVLLITNWHVTASGSAPSEPENLTTDDRSFDAKRPPSNVRFQ